MPALAMLEQVLRSDQRAAGTAAQYWAVSGDIATADDLFTRSTPRPGGPVPDLAGIRPEPALEAIVREARGRRIVIINEAHHAPRHRAFTHQLMIALRKEGFTHFAAETFCATCSVLLANGVPTAFTGPYIVDPVFADLARQAAAVGYGLVAYEMRPDQILPAGTSPQDAAANREQAQAANLKAALDANPTMRVLVHVGFGHLNEASGSMPMFAARLKALTGEDPLTIDQIEGTPQATPEFDSHLYKAFVGMFGKPSMPMVIDNDPVERLGNYSVDLSVMHPAQQDLDGRPDWLAMNGYRKPHLVKLEPLEQRSLVRAFVAGEPQSAIPMDQILVMSGAHEVTLMLPLGHYRLVRQTEAGQDLPLGTVDMD